MQKLVMCMEKKRNRLCRECLIGSFLIAIIFFGVWISEYENETKILTKGTSNLEENDGIEGMQLFVLSEPLKKGTYTVRIKYSTLKEYEENYSYSFQSNQTQIEVYQSDSKQKLFFWREESSSSFIVPQTIDDFELNIALPDELAYAVKSVQIERNPQFILLRGLLLIVILAFFNMYIYLWQEHRKRIQRRKSSSSNVVKQNKRQNVGIELLRVISCIMVIMIHFIMYYKVQDTFLNYIVVYIDAFCRVSVPIFFMISGFFMFRREQAIKEMYYKAIKNIFIPCFLAFLLTTIFSDFLENIKTIQECINEIWNINWYEFWSALLSRTAKRVDDSCGPLWYVMEMIYVYACYPILRYFCKDCKRENAIRRFYIVIGFFANSILDMVNKMGVAISAYIEPLDIFPSAYLLYILLGFELYLLYEKYLKKLETRKLIYWRVLSLFSYILGSIALIILFISVDMFDGEWDGTFLKVNYGFLTLPCVIASVSLFLFAIVGKYKNKTVNRVICFLGDKTYLIYLIHFPLITRFKSLEIQETCWKNWGGFFYIGYTLMLFGICLAIACLVKGVFRGVKRNLIKFE